MKGGRDRDRPTYDDAEAVGEDPFRWLCVYESSPQMVEARIAGIERQDRLDSFLECETEIGPRKAVIALINRRQKQLREQDGQAARADQLTRSAAADGGDGR